MPGPYFKIVPITKNKDYDGFVEASQRYVIVDAAGSVVDDAQGYGYKSQQSAQKAMWYKFKGGKEKIDAANVVGKNYWRDKKKLADAIEECLEMNFKEISRGETTIDDIASAVEKDFGVVLDRRMVDWLLKQ